MSMGRRLDLGLVVSILALAGGLGYQLWAPASEPEAPSVAAPDLPPLPTAMPFNPPPQSSFATIDARPVFSPARQPIESTAVAGTAATAAPPDVSLIGIILDGKTQMALVKREGAPFAESIAAGTQFDGWEVVEITADHVTLRSGVQQITLSMDGRRKSQAAPQNAPNAISPYQPNSPAPFTSRPARSRPPPSQTLPTPDSAADDQPRSDRTGEP